MDLKENKVTQDNALVSASYTMTLDEKRLLIACISKLNPESKAWKEGRARVDITAGEWADLYNIKADSAYKQLNNASIQLYERSVRIHGDRFNGEEIRWLSARKYSQREGMVTLSFSREILFYLTGMIDEFTSYDLLGVSGLKSIHSIRLYELSSQFKGAGWRYIELDELRELFNLGNAYQKWDALKRRVIDRAVQEITQKSDLEVTYEIVKRGRNVVAIKLLITSKDQMELPLG